MKIVRVICLILASLFFLFQLIGYPALVNKEFEGVSLSEKIGYILGYHIFLYVAILFLIIAIRINNKIRRRSIEKTMDGLFNTEQLPNQ